VLRYTQISTSYFYYEQFFANDAVYSDFLLKIWSGVEFDVRLVKGISSMTVGVGSLSNVGGDHFLFERR